MDRSTKLRLSPPPQQICEELALRNIRLFYEASRQGKLRSTTRVFWFNAFVHFCEWSGNVEREARAAGLSTEPVDSRQAELFDTSL